MSYSLTTDTSQKMDALNMICVMGPSHGGRCIAANSYLEGSYTEKYPAIERNRNGLRRRFRQFSWPQGIPSHAPEVPGSIHEGGELGYSLAHAYGAAFDNLDLVAACVQGSIAEFKTGGHVQQLESWLKSYRPEELFDKDGRLLDELAMLAPTGQNRMGCNPHANGGPLLRPLDMPSFRVFAVAVPKPDAVDAEATRPQRLVIAHLGNGASITALKAGQSIVSSMGMTPGGGVIMGTRSGDLDPGVLVYLMREKKFDAAKLEALVDQHSGLLGISGVSGDMRRLHEVAAANPDGRLAIEMFCVSARKQIAAMIAVLGGLDMLVFTGGICENDPHVRDEICRGLSWIGVSLDDSSNRSASNPVSDGPSRCQVLVLASQADEQIALHAWAFLT